MVTDCSITSRDWELAPEPDPVSQNRKKATMQLKSIKADLFSYTVITFIWLPNI